MANESQVIRIEKPGPPAIVQEMAPIVKAAADFAVADVETNTVALERVRNLRTGEKRIHEYFEPARKAADSAKKEIIQARDGLIGPLAEARRIYEHTADLYEQQERRKAEAEQQRLQAEAKKREEERQIQEAILAEESGDHAAAEAILEEPVEAPVVNVAPAVAKVAGVSTRTMWSAEVEDLGKLAVFVAANPSWLNLLLPNQVALNKLATAQQKNLAIPGVRAVSKTVRATRG